MHLTHLSLTNFRNFARLDVDVPRGPLMLVGGNAQGKTSLLEAVYFLATFVSFHASQERQLINFLAAREPLAVARIVADYQRFDRQEPAVRERSIYLAPQVNNGGGQWSKHRLEVRLIQDATTGNGAVRLRKEVLLDGVKRRASEVVGQFNAVLFLPQMMRVVDGAPEERRRYLNLSLAQALPQYAPALSEYTRILTQRNALLKQLNERGGDAQQLAYWDEQLTFFGAQIIHARIHALQELERGAARSHRELTRGAEVLRLGYQPSFDPLPQRQGQFSLPLDTPVDRTGIALEKIQQSFQEALGRVRAEEIARGVTTLGPHRDEMRFYSNGMDLGTYGSRGQGRTAMLSMKLAEVAWMKEKTGQWPVLLLDEVLAELDPSRRADLLERLSESEQALLTTTDLDLFSAAFVQSASRWQIEAGQIIEVDTKNQ